jgi:hypothetical protein
MKGYAILKTTGKKFIIRNIENGKMECAPVNPCNGQARKNAKWIWFPVEKMEVL